MSLTLGTVITAARDRSPWFHKTRATDAVLARYLSDAQNELIGAAVRRDPQYLAQTASIVLQLNASNAPGTVGLGTPGGLPGVVDANGNVSTVAQSSGTLIEANMTADGGAAVFLADRRVTSATATSITSTGANRTTNQDAGRVIVIVTGPGIDERRSVLSNTANTWVISTGADGQQWTTLPTTASAFDVVEAAIGADESIGVVTNVPATTTTTGYLVRLDASGIPFIDYTQPLVATMDTGVPLPSMQFPLDGTVWYTDGSSGPLHLCAVAERFAPARWPAAYLVGQTCYLAGADTTGWQDVASIALRYTPIAPVFTALTDPFLIPDHARPALIAMAAAFMAVRLAADPEVGGQIDARPHLAASASASASFLATVSAAKRGRDLRPRAVF